MDVEADRNGNLWAWWLPPGWSGDPRDAQTTIGPMVSRKQWQRVQDYIRLGQQEGARLLIGGEGRPQGMEKGWCVKPTVFSDVHNQMRIA